MLDNKFQTKTNWYIFNTSVCAPYCRFMIGQYVTVHGDVISHVNISTVRVEDGGEYRCTAGNRVAKVHHAARLNIYGLPHVRPMGSYAAVAGETTVIKCPVAGFPIASITWEKGIYPKYLCLNAWGIYYAWTLYCIMDTAKV